MYEMWRSRNADNVCSKALTYLGRFDAADQKKVDIARILAQAQDEVSPTDVSNFIASDFSAGPELVEYFLSLDPVRDSWGFIEQEGELYPALGAALKNYGAHITGDSLDWGPLAETIPSKWESIVRKLLHIGVNIHAPVPRLACFQPDSYPCTLRSSGTPLDELFTHTTTEGEAKDAANAWLHILSTEGIDVSAYLEKEAALHATRPMITCPLECYNYLPRQLIFDLGEAPTVYADWWIDPQSSSSLIRQEFKETNILADHERMMNRFWVGYEHFSWKSVWPTSYPRWSDLLKPWCDVVEEHATWERLSERAHERADRRWHKKARKAARRNGTQVYSSMPGAWPE